MARRTEVLVLGTATLLITAFVVSFVLGVWRGEASERIQEPTVLNEVAPEPTAPGGGRLEVLNASGRAGLARRATEQLRAAGFDVVYFGNAGGSVGDSSVVIARVLDESVARAAAERLGIASIVTRADSTLLVDATVIVGIDWK